MKKSLLVATMLAVSSIAGSASALDASVVRSLQVSGLGRDLGFLVPGMPLGTLGGQFCDYWFNWYSPFNPNDAAACVLHELRTPLAPSCIINERFDFVTIVQSDAYCAGFNLKGELLPASLMLSETPIGLVGIATFGCPGIPQVYPVITC